MESAALNALVVFGGLFTVSLIGLIFSSEAAARRHRNNDRTIPFPDLSKKASRHAGIAQV